MPRIIRHPREHLEYKYDGHVWIVRSDFAGSAKWTRPDEEGRKRPPYNDFDDYLFAAICPTQREALVHMVGWEKDPDSFDETPPHMFPESARMDAAVSGWRNTNGYTELEDSITKADRLYKAAIQAIQTATADDAETALETAQAALTADNQEVEPDPFSGSSKSSPETGTGGQTRSAKATTSKPKKKR